MAIKKISEFTSATPTASDKILFEQSGAGKNTTIGNAVNTCSLSYEEIMASTDLSGKVASASAVKNVRDLLETKVWYLGDLKTVSAIQAWVVANKPSRAWVAIAMQDNCSVALGGPFNDYEGGYASFLRFGYFNSSVDVYKLNAGSWNK